MQHAKHNSFSQLSPLEACWGVGERVAACGMLVMLTPVIILIAVAIKLDSAGPVLFCQRRRGIEGREFGVIKFRSMYVGTDRHSRLGITEGDSRITRVGRVIRATKLDEIPQLWNIVIGQMRFVGPRPLPRALDEVLEQHIPGFRCRYSVKPGLTSLAQICVSDNQVGEHMVSDWSMRFEVERRYIERRNARYDLVVIAMTMVFVLRKAAKK